VISGPASGRTVAAGGLPSHASFGQGVEPLNHFPSCARIQSRHWQVSARHQQKKILLAIDSECFHGLNIVDPSQGEIQQGSKVVVAMCLGCFISLNQMSQLCVESTLLSIIILLISYKYV
jgi:hypothetical protein